VRWGRSFVTDRWPPGRGHRRDRYSMPPPRHC